MLVPEISRLFLLNYVCIFFIDTVVLFSQRRNIRSVDVIVQKFADVL